MKVLQVIDSLQVGGAEKIAVQISNLLKEHGALVELVVLHTDGILRKNLDPTIPVHFLFRKSRLDIKAAKKIADLAQKFDLIHVHMRHNFRYVTLIKKLFSFNGKVVFHDHYGSIEVDKSVPRGFKTMFKPSFYIGVSEELTTWALEKLKLPRERVFLLENTIRPFPAIASPDSDHSLVLVSNIKPIKNQLFAIELAQELDENLTIFGVIQDQAYWEKIHARVCGELPSQKIKFVHNCSEVQPLLSAFQMGLNTSIAESGPLVLLEFLAQGLPFLAYNTGSISRKLSKEFPEYFLNHFNKETWLDRIKEIRQKPPDKEKMAMVFKKYFSEEQYLKKCLTIYQQVRSF